ncbi:MAG: pyruvate dehydrogenase (acetyl-transferring) E1 component subunit alpha [Alicyclobacillus sp.]|nr:pyruvate dehydrogenase (acetyl-transferring) E1 component subunit alpha [Alicyclobacillus sp.]
MKAHSPRLYEELQVLRSDGEVTGPIDDIPPERMREMYRWMVLMRGFDKKCVTWQRQGRIGTYAPFEGQEAAQVGSALALSNSDWMFPTYRDHAAAMVHGQTMANVLLYWMGRMEGCVSPPGVRVLPPCVPIATHLLHAVGLAFAMTLRGERAVAIAYFGDGATSEGDFHEALNFAGVFRLPVIFLCQNNGYAISVPFSRQSASRTIAQRAVAYDIPGVRVDGNDVFAVHRAVTQARERAVAGLGPTLIEAVTFRYGAHTTADDPTRYRDQRRLSEEWRTQRDPIARLRLYLERRDLWSAREEEAWQAEAAALVEEAMQEAMAAGAADPLAMFQHVYADEPWHLAKQRREMLESRGGASA